MSKVVVEHERRQPQGGGDGARGDQRRQGCELPGEMVLSDERGVAERFGFAGGLLPLPGRGRDVVDPKPECSTNTHQPAAMTCCSSVRISFPPPFCQSFTTCSQSLIGR